MARAKGFTLVELLVVIGIISVLAAMLLPTLEQALESTRRTKCAGTLKQIHLSAALYADDFDGKTPYYPLTDASYCSDSSMYWITASGDTGWCTFIKKKYMTPDLVTCPSMDVKPVFSGTGTGLHYSFRYNSYRSIRWGAMDSDPLSILNAFRINDSKLTKAVVFHEAVDYRRPGEGSPCYASTVNWGQRRWAHMAGGNAARCDGAVKWIPQSPTAGWWPFNYYLYRPNYIDALFEKAR